MNSRKPLHILLTNDDGHGATGIRTLHNALKSRGHRVNVLAPSTEQSATGMATTMRRNMVLERVEDDLWHLDAQPADTVLVGLRHLLEDDPPDLVLSGINFGPNLGVGLHASGTVGAAITAVLSGIPAIAVSAGILYTEAREKPPRFESTLRAYEPAALFTCEVIESLLENPEADGRLLPQGVMLNINYPALPPEQIRGVRYPEVSPEHLIHLVYRTCDQTGHLVPRYIPGVDFEKPDGLQGDVRDHIEGYITISPVKPSWNPSSEQSEELRGRLASLRKTGNDSESG